MNTAARSLPRSKGQTLLLLAAVSLATTGTATAQSVAPRSNAERANDRTAAPPVYADPMTMRFRVGVIVTAANGPVRNLRAGCAVPGEWPEQRVRLVGQHNNLAANVQFEVLEGTARQMVVTVPLLPAGQTLEVIHTYEVTRYRQLPPAGTDALQAAEDLPRDLRRYVGPTPGIESNDRNVRNLHQQLALEEGSRWEQIQRYYDWTRENIEYVQGPLKGARQTIRGKQGDCEDLTAVFIALCRREGIPARTVWVPGHVWAEFYLQDSATNGRWFPAELTGPREFGCITAYRPILQKGDRFKSGGRSRATRYLGPWLRGNGGRAKFDVVSEVLPAGSEQAERKVKNF